MDAFLHYNRCWQTEESFSYYSLLLEGILPLFWCSHCKNCDHRTPFIGSVSASASELVVCQHEENPL